MALVLKDRVKETTTTTGTGTYTLAGAVGGFEAFSQIGDGNTTYYACTDGTDFEVGVGTYTASGTTLARTTILQSSNSDNAVSWGSGTRTIFCTQPAEKAVFIDENNDVLISPDTDNFAQVGRAIVGHSFHNNFAGFRHANVTGSIYYALLQGSTGATYLNGSSVNFRVANSQQAQIYSGGFFLNSGKVISFEGSTSDDYETTLTVIDPTADRTISLPNATGTVVLEDSSGDVSVTNDLTVSGDLFVNGGTIRAEDGTLDFGDFSGDNWGQISYQSSDTNGFDAQFNNAIRFSNEQGSTNQHMLLLDTAANNSADLWGVSVGNTPIVSITGQSKIVLHEADGGSNTTTISPTSPTADRTITLPNATGTVLLTDGDGSSLTALNATQLTSGTVPNARLDAQLQDVAGLAVTNGNFIVGDGSNFVAESGATARTSLGLGTAAVLDTGISNTNVPKFTSGVADNDFLRVDGTAIEGRSASEVLSDIGATTAAAAADEATALAIALG